MSTPGRFRFLDDTDAQRQLGVDRLTFEELLRSGRLRPVSSSGEKTHFFRAADVARLRGELHPESEAEDADSTAQPTDGSLLVTPAAPPAPAKKGHDPAMRVHLRLTADLKWYDISDDDVRAWFDQLRPDAYERQRANASFVISRMRRIIALIDEGEARAGSQ